MCLSKQKLSRLHNLDGQKVRWLSCAVVWLWSTVNSLISKTITCTAEKHQWWDFGTRAVLCFIFRDFFSFTGMTSTLKCSRPSWSSMNSQTSILSRRYGGLVLCMLHFSLFIILSVTWRVFQCFKMFKYIEKYISSKKFIQQHWLYYCPTTLRATSDQKDETHV